MKLQGIILLFVLPMLFALPAKAETINVKNENTYYYPSRQLAYYFDRQKCLKIHEISKPDFAINFIDNNSDIPSFGFSNDVLWLRFQVANNTGKPLMLEIDNSEIDTISYYLLNEKGVVIHQQKLGIAPEHLDYPGGLQLLEMNLPDSDTYTCYLRIESTTSLMLPMRIACQKQYYAAANQRAMSQGLYFGIILFLIVYNIFLFGSLKDPVYAYFALVIANFGLIFANLNGIGRQYILDFLPQIMHSIPFLGSLAGIFIVLFSTNFLRTAGRTPRLHKLLISLLWIFTAAALLSVYDNSVITTNVILAGYSLTLFFLMFVGYKALVSGYKPAKYFLFAWSFYVIGVVLATLRDNGMMEVNVFTKSILQITSTISILFMSFAISKKINIYKQKRDEAKSQALKALVANEKLISEQNKMLEARVLQRTKDLEQSISALSVERKSLQQANDFKGKIISIISHDMKSPISTLIGMLELMKLKNLGALEQRKVVEHLEFTLTNTRNLLDNMLLWANQKQCNKEINEIALHEVTEETLALFKYQSELKSIKLTNLIMPGFYINSDKNMLQLVMRNLISNAIKFTDRGGEIVLGMEMHFPDLKIFVKDNGIGMSTETINRLFSEYDHVSTRGTENEKGTGLGLKLCREFVQRRGGKLTVESVEGKGSCFTIHLNDVIAKNEMVAV